MKKNVLLMAMMMVSSIIFAQKNADRSAMAEKQAGKMKTDLSLTEEQFTRIKEINEKFSSNQARLLADTAMTRENVRLERKRMQDERNTQIKGVLTEEQFSQWTAMKAKEMKKGQTKARAGGRAGNQMEEMKTELGLTDDQYKKVMAINARMAGRVKKLRADTTISRENVRAEMKKVKEERNAAIKTVLTEDQYSRFLAYEAEKANNRRREISH